MPNYSAVLLYYNIMRRRTKGRIQAAELAVEWSGFCDALTEAYIAQ